MSKKPVIQPQDKYVLRMPDGLRDKIKAYAERNGRSMNAEIVARLEASEDPGAAEAGEWKRRFEEAREEYVREQKLHDKSLEMAFAFRSLLRTSNAQTLQQLAMVRTLANIIISLDGQPSHEVVRLAQDMELAASEARERLSALQEIDHHTEEK